QGIVTNVIGRNVYMGFNINRFRGMKTPWNSSKNSSDTKNERPKNKTETSTFNTVSRFFGSLFSSTKNSNVKTPSNPVTRDSADSSPISKGLKEVAKQAPQTIKQNSSGSEPNYSESDSENQSLDEHPAGPSHSMDSS